jgi:hypothetical protein
MTTLKEKVYKVYLRSANQLFNNPTIGEPSRKPVVRDVTKKWLNGESREKLLNELYSLRSAIQKKQLAATGYDAETIRQFFADIVLDIQAQVDDLRDYSSQLMNVTSIPDASKYIKLRELLPYVGKEDLNSGTLDAFPLIEHALASLEEITIDVRGFGDKYGLNEELFNPSFSIDRITQSAARIIVDEANADFFKPVVLATYDAAHTQTFISATGASNDVNTYNTVAAAVDKVLALFNPFANKYNYKFNPKLVLLISQRDQRKISPIVNGELSRLTSINQLTPALVDNIIAYDGGLNDGASYANGAEILSYPGIPSGTAYVYAINDVYGARKINKVDVTMDIQDGDILTSCREKRRWYRARGVYLDSVLPTTVSGKAAGAIIKVNLS